MNILFFHGLGEPDSPRVEVTEVAKYDVGDDTTARFEGVEIANIDVDNGEYVTIYTKGGGFYIVLTRADIAEIVQAASGLVFYMHGSDQPFAQKRLEFFDKEGPLVTEVRGFRVFLEPILEGKEF